MSAFRPPLVLILLILVVTYSFVFSATEDSLKTGAPPDSVKPILFVRDSAKVIQPPPDSNIIYSVLQDSSKFIPIRQVYDEPLVDTSIVVSLIDFRNTKIVDILTALAKANNVNMSIDQIIDRTATVYFKNIRLNNFLEFLISEYALSYEKKDGLLKIYKSQPPPPPGPTQRVEFAKDRLTIDVTGLDISDLARKLVESTGYNVIVDRGASGKVSGFIKQADFEGGLTGFLQSNGFELAKRGEVYFISAIDTKKVGQTQYIPGGVTISDSLISLNVKDADLKPLLDEIASKAGLQVIYYGDIQGKVSARCKGLSPEEAFQYILRGTGQTYSREENIFFVGPTTMNELATTRLIRLKHLAAANILELIPEALASKLTLKIVREQDALMAVGPLELVDQLEHYISEIDHPPAQVLIEALVVDYVFTDHYEFGIEARSFPFADSIRLGDTYYPSIDYTADSKVLNRSIQDLANQFSIKNVGRLPANFFVRLNALAQEGKANIKSRPQIATLNGHEAKIDVGTTQYFLLKTETNYGVGQPSVSTQVSEKFETIEASMSLTITPWVNASNEIIATIHPEFNTPQGAFDSRVPPTINHRILDSNVRLRDGETIVLGGLIQTNENVSDTKFPILGDIPLLGRIFRNRFKTKTNSELVIYLTPKIYYGSEGAVDISKYRK
jgi:type IV pilus assembly protein PilQ